MIKQKNKGMTSIEFLAAFAIISVIVVGLFDVVLNYKNKQQIETIYSEVTAYANSLQKVIQDDLIKNRITSVSLSSNKNATITFSKVSPSRILKITTGKYDEANDLKVLSVGQIEYNNIKYPLPDIPDLIIDEQSEITVEKDNNTGFSYLKIYIVLRHPNFSSHIDEEEYGIYDFKITCPINYSN